MKKTNLKLFAFCRKIQALDILYAAIIYRSGLVFSVLFGVAALIIVILFHYFEKKESFSNMINRFIFYFLGYAIGLLLGAVISYAQRFA